jgi:cob(I)alamin adenosyltransferase
MNSKNRRDDMCAGYVQVYTGEGKGKTTAAFGLALRAAGAGLRVFIAQFVKGMHYSEITALERFEEITLKQYGIGCFIFGEPTPEDCTAARQGLSEIKPIVAEGGYDVVILDEINIATRYGLVSVDDVLALIECRPPGVELVLTGRYADERILERADLITEMVEKKHYYKQGVPARTGIEK